jgi:hypothetical protein
MEPKLPSAGRRADHKAAARRHAGQGAGSGWRWLRMLDVGDYTSVSEIGDAEDISKSYAVPVLPAVNRCLG